MRTEKVRGKVRTRFSVLLKKKKKKKNTNF